MENDFKKLKDFASGTRLSHDEKSGIRRFLEVYTKTYAPLPRFSMGNFFYRPVIAALFLFLLTGGIALQAESAIPGDILYGVKTNVNEKVAGAFSSSDDKQLAWEANLQERRLGEQEKLFEKEFAELERDFGGDTGSDGGSQDESEDAVVPADEDFSGDLEELELQILQEENTGEENLNDLESEIREN